MSLLTLHLTSISSSTVPPHSIHSMNIISHLGDVICKQSLMLFAIAFNFYRKLTNNKIFIFLILMNIFVIGILLKISRFNTFNNVYIVLYIQIFKMFLNF